VVDVTSESFRPGGAANAINNIRAPGGDVVAVGVVGDDWYGRRMFEQDEVVGLGFLYRGVGAANLEGKSQ